MQKAPASQPQYKISYSKCQKGNLHQGQILNIVCLNKECANKSLICSICKTESHVDHTIKPLKFYIHELSEKYAKGSAGDINDRLDELDRGRNEYLLAIQEVVEELAQRFKELEKIIISRYDALRSELLQEESLKNQFPNLYDVISVEGHPETAMLLQQYLPKKAVPELPKPDKIKNLRNSMTKPLTDAIDYYSTAESDADNTLPDVPKLNLFNLILPPEVSLATNTITPKNDNPYLCLFGNKITTENPKIKLRIASNNPKCAFGIITMGEFKQCNFIWSETKVNSKVYWVTSEGKHANANFTSITPLAKGDVIDLSFKKGQLVINSKKNKGYATFIVKNIAQDWYFFVGVAKQTQIEILNVGGNAKKEK